MDQVGFEPLSIFFFFFFTSLTELLLSAGADILAIDCDKNSAIHHACMNQHEDAALLLLDKIDADTPFINATNAEMKT